MGGPSSDLDEPRNFAQTRRTGRGSLRIRRAVLGSVLAGPCWLSRFHGAMGPCECAAQPVRPGAILEAPAAAPGFPVGGNGHLGTVNGQRGAMIPAGNRRPQNSSGAQSSNPRRGKPGPLPESRRGRASRKPFGMNGYTPLARIFHQGPGLAPFAPLRTAPLHWGGRHRRILRTAPLPPAPSPRIGEGEKAPEKRGGDGAVAVGRCLSNFWRGRLQKCAAGANSTGRVRSCPKEAAAPSGRTTYCRCADGLDKPHPGRYPGVSSECQPPQW
jgi:hypothetical protein